MIGLLRTIILCLLFLAAAGCRRAPNPEPILIGHLAPFNGADKEIGEHAKQAITLAVEEVNQEANRINGRTINVLHPVYAPDEPDRLQPVAVRLITVNRVVALLGGTNLGDVGRLQRAAQPYEAPLICFAELPPELLSETIFSVNAGLAFQAEVLARFARQELKADQVAVLVDGREASCTALADIFGKEFSRANTNRVHEWTYKTASDLSDLVERVRKVQPKAILHAGTVGDLGRLRAKLQAAGIRAPLLFGGDAEHLALSSAEREATNDVVVASPHVPKNMSEENEKFVRKYQERFHQLPDVHAALAYDGIRVLFEAMRRAESFQPGKILTALKEMTTKPFDKSLSGSWMFDKNHSARRALYVGKLENGVVTDPKTYVPESK